MNQPCGEPTTVHAGDTFAWSRQVPQYPASDDWTLHYVFRGPATQQADAIADGDDYAVTIAASATAAWQPGSYRWRCFVSRGAEQYAVAAGWLTVLQDLATAPADYDPRSPARKILDSIDAVIEGRASAAEASTTINGRTIQFIPIAELLTLRDRYRTIVAREDAADRCGGEPSSPFGRVLVRFDR